MGGPPPGYNPAVMSQQQRGMSGPMGRVPPQYSGLVPVPRPGNVQVSTATCLIMFIMFSRIKWNQSQFSTMFIVIIR